MKQLLSVLLIVSMLLAFSACGENVGNVSVNTASGAKTEVSSAAEPESSEVGVPSVRPTADGQSIDIGDLHFYLPADFKPHDSNVYNGAQRYYTGILTDIATSNGMMLTINTYNPKEGFSLENYVNYESMASIARADMHSTSFNGIQWYSGVGLGKNYYYGLYNNKLYELIFEPGEASDTSVNEARNMLESTLYFSQAEE